METDRHTVQDWCFQQFAQRLAEVFEAMAGARPEIRAGLAPAPSSGPEAGGLRWRQRFNGAPGAIWIHAADKDWTEAGNRILRAAGLEDADLAALKSTWTEILGQTLSVLAGDISDRAAREITCAAGEESTEPPAAQGMGAQWAGFSVQFPGEAAPAMEFAGAIEDGLLDALLSPPALKIAAAASGADSPGSPTPATLSPSASKTFDLLLDVELPVSVSFGRAQVPLKDVIKLTTGAIVELNRSITEPVEVIVNNCVIARGEVVVVDGNFGVRIREVISRQARLRTLN